jgi:hypothetical protein
VQPGAGEDCFLTSLTFGDTGQDEAADVEPLEEAGQQREAWGVAGTKEGGPMPTVTGEDGGEGGGGRGEFNSFILFPISSEVLSLATIKRAGGASEGGFVEAVFKGEVGAGQPWTSLKDFAQRRCVCVCVCVLCVFVCARA